MTHKSEVIILQLSFQDDDVNVYFPVWYSTPFGDHKHYTHTTIFIRIHFVVPATRIHLRIGDSHTYRSRLLTPASILHSHTYTTEHV